VLDAGGLDRVNEALGDAAQAESAGADRHAIEQQPVERGGGVGIDFLHASLPRDRPADSRAARSRSTAGTRYHPSRRPFDRRSEAGPPKLTARKLTGAGS